MSKKINKIVVVAVVALLALSLMTFAACDKLKDLGRPVIETGDKEATVIIGEDSYYVKTGANYVHDLLVELKAAGEITYEFSISQYGAYIEALGNLNLDEQGAFIAVYHDIADDTLIDYEYGTTLTVDGKEFHSSIFGVSELPVYSGATYLFKVEVFSY